MPSASKRRQQAARKATGNGSGGGDVAGAAVDTGEKNTANASSSNVSVGSASPKSNASDSSVDVLQSGTSVEPATAAGRVNPLNLDGPAPLLPGLTEPPKPPSPPRVDPTKVALEIAKTHRFKPVEINRRLVLPTAAYALLGEYEEKALVMPTRPKQTNTSGKAVKIGVNSYSIMQYPTKTVYQYDVLVGSGVEKRGLIRKVWESKTLQSKLGPSWIFDGNRLAWSLEARPTELNVVVDLDAEAGRPSTGNREDKHRVQIRRTTKVPLAALQAYLEGKVSFDTGVLEAINFLDHLLRHTPSGKFIPLKSSFFSRDDEKHKLGGAVEAFKGVYQSIRACQGGRLGVNVDVSNGAFWVENGLNFVVMELVGCTAMDELVHKLDPVRKPGQINVFETSPGFKELRRMRRVAIYPRFLHNKPREQVFHIECFIQENAKEYKFKWKHHDTGIEEEVSVYDYYKRRYNIMLDYYLLPLVKTTKKDVVYPMELVWTMPNQKYPFKLDENQTSRMIKFAVTRPEKRAQDIHSGIKKLDWGGDPAHKAYGLKINNTMIQTAARVLPPPNVQFQGTTASPGTSGRWDLRGPKRFIVGNKVPLDAWAVCVFPLRYPTRQIDLPAVQHFVREFMKSYMGHGGRIECKTPLIHYAKDNPAEGVEQTWTKAKQHFKKLPQIILFVLPDRNGFFYFRIKKSCDCRFGVLSQCLQGQQMLKSNPQYLSNIAMKFNAKLGGATARISGRNMSYGSFAAPSLVIGADVSHGPSMTDQPSMAAITVSIDKLGIRYAAACETNGRRVEMITTRNIHKMFTNMYRDFMTDVNEGRLPEHVYYFRDGVSEGQYQHVLMQEVRDIKAAMLEVYPKSLPKMIVIVASKRHHIRFFPNPRDAAAADRNGNPFPGTLVEKDVTHPFENDFYLCSHAALQGTSRPVHYHVLLDEIGLSPNQLHAMIYEHCYQYIRSTTPVSLHPAIYYAHLASNRARCHENIPASSGPRSGPDMKKSAYKKDPTVMEPLPLLEFANVRETKIDKAMWYI